MGGPSPASRIAGISTLKGLVLYGATLTFAGLYIYFIVKISDAAAGRSPTLDAALISRRGCPGGCSRVGVRARGRTTSASSATNTALDAQVNAANGALAL